MVSGAASSSDCERTKGDGRPSTQSHRKDQSTSKTKEPCPALARRTGRLHRASLPIRPRRRSERRWCIAESSERRRRFTVVTGKRSAQMCPSEVNVGGDSSWLHRFVESRLGSLRFCSQ
jgi:hypothetical protein